MEFRRLYIAIDRKPIAGIILRIGPAIDTAVVYLDEVAGCIKNHFARVRMRRTASSRATAWNGRNVVSMRQVLPLRGRNLACGRYRRVATKQPPREIHGTYKVRKR